ncbi:MAG TPA: hypothetical protein GX717_06545 [Clostridiaceae bacterium]|nr:hypothetical protein [Clostridiaceae bacterium]
MQRDACVQFVFYKVPTQVQELMMLPEAMLDSPFKTAALAMLALLQYEGNPEISFAMLDALSGPEPLTPYKKSFIRDRLMGKAYKVRSFFSGATVDNNYTPTQPYRISVLQNPYSFSNENWATLYVQSSGADSPRPIKLRRKPSTNQWFLNELECLGDIRPPRSADPWA